MKARLLGIHTVHKRLASGKIATYHYAWRGGPRITAKAGTRKFIAEYVSHTRTRPEAPYAGSMAALVRAYLASPEFARLRPATAAEYRRYIDEIDAEFFDLPLSAINDLGARATFLEWRDRYAAKPRHRGETTAVVGRGARAEFAIIHPCRHPRYVRRRADRPSPGQTAPGRRRGRRPRQSPR